MEPQPTTSADVGITTQSVTSIDLDASQLTVPPQTAWNIQEQQREHEGRSRLKALQWVYRQDSSRPAPGTFINSPPLDMRMRHNDEIVGLVDNILHQPSHLDTSDSKPSSALAIPAAALTARRDRGHPASADGSSFQDRLLDSSSAFQVLEPTSSFADRNPKYHDTGHHDEGRPPDTLDSDGWQASSSVLSDPQTRGVKEEHVPNPGRHQVHWAPTNPSETDTGSVTKKQPKRQNSRLTDDEQGTRRRRKRHRTGLKGRSPRTSPAVSGSTNSPRQAESRLPQTGTGRSRQQTQREPHSHPGPGSSSFHEQVEHDSDCRFSEENFIGADETCFFWLHDNRKYSGRNACRGRKIEISHIVTHAVDHHGLIRGKDIRYTNRGYLMSCQTHDPETKATGTCAKCKSLQDWRGGDFDDPAHHGMPGYQPTQSSSSGQAQWSSMQRSLVTNTQTLFDNNFMYTGDLQDPSMPRIQATTPIDDFDGILPLEMLHSQPTPSQATASQVPSTMGEPQPMPSPDMDEPKWLKDPDDDGLDDFFYQIGSNPALQASIGRQNAPVRQQTLRPQDSSPDGLIPFGQQTKIEQDSAYESIRQGNPELDGNLNTMYQPTELDNMEIEEDFSTELGKYFDIERACQSPDACQEAPFTSRGFF
ncbi:hypothetical protein ACHAPT_008603 [Fusarium lateritium]